MTIKQRVLVTNDDGIDAEGIRVLVASLVAEGYEPIVVAPDSDYSGAGTSLLGLTGQHPEIRYERRVLPEAPDAEAYAVAGPPALCALLAMREAFGPRADLVVSGINYGVNTGMAVRHSGTVSAALTAASFGVPALAISSEFDLAQPDRPLRYDTAAAIGMRLLRVLPGSRHQMLNLNVPCCGIDELAGIRSAPIAQVSRYRSFVESHDEGVLKMGYRMSDEPVPVETDTGLIQAGFASVSSLVGVGSLDCAALITQVAEAAV